MVQQKIEKERKVLVLNRFFTATRKEQELQKALDEGWEVSGSVGENTVILERGKKPKRETLTD
jgi:hypothetical protein